MGQEQPKWILQADIDIKNGEGHKVLRKLRSVQSAGVPKKNILEIAKLARRVGMYHFGANILFRIYNDPTKSKSPGLLAEYAACLAGAGNYIEAERIFSELPESILNEYAISYADSLFRIWNFKRANQILVQFTPYELNTYKDLVYGLNLAASHIVVGEFKKAENLLDKILAFAQDKDHKMIYANCLELKGQIYFDQEDFENALRLFEESEKLLRDTNNVSWLFSLKWCAVSQLKLSKGSPRSKMKLNQVRTEARKYLNWETLRECDLYESIYTENEKLFSKVYFATPHEAFRQKALKLSGAKFQLNPSIEIGPKGCQKSFELDLLKAEFSSKSSELGLNENLKKLLLSVTSDLYRPTSIYQIFHDVFSGEHYNPLSSKQKTYKMIKAFRKAIEGHPARLSLGNLRNYGYRFRCEASLSIIYPLENQIVDSIHSTSQLQVILEEFGDQEFSRKDYCMATKSTDRSANRALKELESTGKLQKIGQGRSTKYRIAG